MLHARSTMIAGLCARGHRQLLRRSTRALSAGADARLDALVDELGLASLPPAPPRGGVYRPTLIDGKYIYFSGHGPWEDDGTKITGRLRAGNEDDIAHGVRAARHTALAVLSTLRAELGSLEPVERVVKTLGMVNCDANFASHPLIINGYSDVMLAVFGDDLGLGVRSAVGMGSLPDNITVEVEGVFRLK